MNQAVFDGFGPQGKLWRKPENMPGEVVALCKSEADAITWSINYARKRFGYRQIDIAKLCGWESDNHLSAYKKAPDGSMPTNRWNRFAIR